MTTRGPVAPAGARAAQTRGGVFFLLVGAPPPWIKRRNAARAARRAALRKETRRSQPLRPPLAPAFVAAAPILK